MVATVHQSQADGASPEERTIKVFPILTCAHGDSPWSAKLAGACGHAATNGCFRCGVQGTQFTHAGDRLKATSYGCYADQGPARTYDMEQHEWKEEKVCLAKQDADGGWVFDRELAERLKTSDDVFVARGNTADNITEQVQAARAAGAAAGANTPPIVASGTNMQLSPTATSCCQTTVALLHADTPPMQPGELEPVCRPEGRVHERLQRGQQAPPRTGSVWQLCLR